MNLGNYLTIAGRAGFTAGTSHDSARWELMSIAGNSLEFYPRANEIERWVWRGSNGRSFTGYNPRALAEFLVKISTVA